MARRAPDLPLPSLVLDAASATPLHRQIYFALRGAILAGQLRPGTRLPASRTLARVLGLSRSTVLAAFEQLGAEGYLAGRIGQGSFVPADLPDEAAGPAPQQAASPTGPTTSRRRPAARAAALQALARRPAARRAFAPGLPELQQFPFKDWARLLGRRWRRPDPACLAGAEPGGYPPLRTAIAGYLATARAVFCASEQVIVTAGAQQALDLAARVLLDPGDPVWFEEPGYRPAAAVLTARPRGPARCGWCARSRRDRRCRRPARHRPAGQPPRSAGRGWS
jgi:GntR family transcriptional regulator/MocR family aminotransferase